MSGILAQYAQNIAHAADNVQNAYAAQAQVQAEGARATQAALAGIKESFDKSEQMKLEQQRLDTEKELATQKLEEEGKFLKTIALTDKVGDPAKAMQIVNSEIEQARAQRAANAPKRTSLSDLTVGGIAAAGADKTPSTQESTQPTKASELTQNLTTPPNTQALSIQALSQMPNPKGTPKGYGSFTGYTGGLSSLHDTTTPLLK